MYYKELLSTRWALMWYAIILTVAAIGTVAINLAVGVHPDAKTLAHKPVLPVELFAGIGGVLATFLATILGSSLSSENEGHLDFVGTRPISRGRYAMQTLLVNATGIAIAELYGAFLAGIVALTLAQRAVTWQAGPDTLTNIIRFLLFPLAWYGLCQLITAGLRDRGGLVAGLMWPINIALLVFAVVPLPAIWHTVFTVLNFLNPFWYSSYQVADNGVATPSGLAVVIDVLALCAIALGGALVAMLRWRRVEA
jgi:hypothetical protein